ncbi:MAG: phospho-N-acetylmuramoyl-pentapeptide-transferase, partial [Clostridia bacterium]|nr:phospho-N-acetylmuramoyl-pentapeptide-transferase [Clostridia bacterium]
AYAIECPLILLPIGIVYVIEALSDVIQIGSIKIRHKKVFKMAPNHHHFEMCGWNEKKIVRVFTLVSTIGCIIGVAAMYLTVK